MHSIDNSRRLPSAASVRDRISRRTALDTEVSSLPCGAAEIGVPSVGNGLPGFFGGVPMHWMNDWPTPFPILVESAKGATITDVVTASSRLDDFLPRRHRLDVRPFAAAGGARHPPPGRPRPDLYVALGRRARHRAAAAGERFGLPFWQIATTATDANRFALRVARAITGREKILVFNGCYHGSVDETMVRLIDGKTGQPAGTG